MSCAIEFQVTARQADFIEAQCDEVLFGGAAGGGKSHGQVVDALLFALRHAGSRQLILRRTMPELERTLVRTARELYPADLCGYTAERRLFSFCNRSTIEFGYCDSEADVYRYQSAEYDTIRFDELTHFTEYMYTYLISRLRGANDFPKQMKSTTNPGGIGHDWVRRRFVNIGPPDAPHETPAGSRIFLPARVQDNNFLMRHDPDYLKRLQNLPESERRALLFGDWDITDGRFFSEFDRALHVVRPFVPPAHWPVYFAMDYGLDMLAGYWIAVSPDRRAYVIREIYEPDLIISEAAGRIASQSVEPVRAYIAPPDLWNRRQDSGRSAADIFLEHGIELVKAPAARMAGWLELKEWLRPQLDEQGNHSARLVLFDSCVYAIRALGSIACDARNPGDCATAPHELTHAPDALRYFVASQLWEEGRAATRDEGLAALLAYGGR